MLWIIEPAVCQNPEEKPIETIVLQKAEFVSENMWIYLAFTAKEDQIMADIRNKINICINIPLFYHIVGNLVLIFNLS